MAVRRLAAFLCLTAVGSLGCRVENPPSRREIAQERRDERARQSPPPPLPLPQGDDAQRVLEACGRPASDTVTPIYDKIYNGPVRRMLFFNRQAVIMEFIPTTPYAQQVDEPAPFSAPLRAPAMPPANAIWRFQAARVGEREFLTSRRFEIYLPCAAHALADEL